MNKALKISGGVVLTGAAIYGIVWFFRKPDAGSSIASNGTTATSALVTSSPIVTGKPLSAEQKVAADNLKNKKDKIFQLPGEHPAAPVAVTRVAWKTYPRKTLQAAPAFGNPNNISVSDAMKMAEKKGAKAFFIPDQNIKPRMGVYQGTIPNPDKTISFFAEKGQPVPAWADKRGHYEEMIAPLTVGALAYGTLYMQDGGTSSGDNGDVMRTSF